MRIELPFPPASLFPNRSAGKHWGTKHSDKVAFRDGAHSIAMIAKRRNRFAPTDARYPVKVTFCVNRDNKDADNMLSACKSILDGVALGLGMNDKQFRPITLDVEKTKGPQCVIFEIEAGHGALRVE